MITLHLLENQIKVLSNLKRTRIRVAILPFSVSLYIIHENLSDTTNDVASLLFRKFKCENSCHIKPQTMGRSLDLTYHGIDEDTENRNLSFIEKHKIGKRKKKKKEEDKRNTYMKIYKYNETKLVDSLLMDICWGT